MFPGLLSAYGPDTAREKDPSFPQIYQENCPQPSDLQRILETLTGYMHIFQTKLVIESVSLTPGPCKYLPLIHASVCISKRRHSFAPHCQT